MLDISIDFLYYKYYLCYNRDAFPLTKDKKMKLLLLILFQFRENDEMEHDNAFSVPTISFKRRVYFNLIISLLFSFALYYEYLK